MRKKVIIFGASGHGRVIADIVRANGDEFLGFLDDDITKPSLGIIADYRKFDAEFVVGIGNEETRERISQYNCKWYTAVHPSAIVSQEAEVGIGSVVMANAVINSGARVGKHCVINTGAIIEHDDRIEDFAHISVGVKLGGNVTVGKGTWVGIGATVNNNLNIRSNCIIGAGAVVVKDIIEQGVYIGLPARRVK